MSAAAPLGLGLAVASGLCMAVNILAYRIGQARGIAATHIALHLSLVGGAFFALCAGSAWATVPLVVVALGLGCGLLQYANAHVIGAALRLGPLSPLNCALFLGFTVVVAYSCLQFGERLSVLQSIGLALAVLSVVMGALQGTPPVAGAAPRPSWRYAAVLAAAFLINPTVNLAIKYLAMTPLAGAPTDGPGEVALLERYGDVLFACLNAGLAAALIVEAMLRRPGAAPIGRAVPAGLLAAAGAITGLMALRASAGLPAATVFASSAMATIVAGALLSVWLFAERRSRSWWAMMGCSIAAAAAFAWDASLRG